MAIFEKTVDEYSYKDLEELLGVVESTILEFKSALDPSDPWNDLLKELVSFANTYGGYLILGAKVDEIGRQPLVQGTPSATPNSRERVSALPAACARRAAGCNRRVHNKN